MSAEQTQNSPIGLNWAGEFQDPAKELAFRRDMWPHTARHARNFSVWASLLFVLTAIANYMVVGASAYFYQTTATRILVPLAAVWPYLAAKRPEYTSRSDLPLTVLCCLAGLIQSYGIYAWPVGVNLPFYGVLAMCLIFWLFVPVGMANRFIQSMVLNTAFLIAYTLGGHDWGSPQFFTALSALAGINVLGFFTMRQFNASRRVQFTNTKRTAEAEENYRQVIDHAAEGIIVIQDGRVVFANPTLYKISKYKPEEVIGSPLDQYLPPEAKQTMLGYSRRRIEGGEVPDAYQAKLLMAGGKWIAVEIRGVVITWQGRPAVLYFLADISRRLKAQAEEREVAKLQGVMEMAGAASHEVNQPLQVMTTLTELAKLELPPDSPVQARLLAMEEAIERLRQLTVKIQRVSRYETRDYSEKTRIIDIDKASSE